MKVYWINEDVLRYIPKGFKNPTFVGEIGNRSLAEENAIYISSLEDVQFNTGDKLLICDFGTAYKYIWFE